VWVLGLGFWVGFVLAGMEMRREHSLSGDWSGFNGWEE
jgi:hypothetical protein